MSFQISQTLKFAGSTRETSISLTAGHEVLQATEELLKANAELPSPRLSPWEILHLASRVLEDVDRVMPAGTLVPWCLSQMTGMERDLFPSIG